MLQNGLHDVQRRSYRSLYFNLKQTPFCLSYRILGLGHNGHLGLIEPDKQILPAWHMTKLTSGSLDHSMLRGYNAKPTFGLTLGMRDILMSKHILLLVSSSHKKDVLKKLFNKKVSTSFPASFLWLHSNVTVLCDQKAAVSLQELMLRNE